MHVSRRAKTEGQSRGYAHKRLIAQVEPRAAASGPFWSLTKMTTRIGNRFPLSRIAHTAIGEIRLAVQAAPGGLRYVAPIIVWAIASIGLGGVLGLAAVALPPMGAFGIVAVVGLVLLWVMPDLPLVSPGLIRKAFFVMLVTDLCVPYYYTFQLSGLPWISARRVATVCLLAPFFVAVAASSDVRRQIWERVRRSLPIVICAIGFLVMATLSVLTSMLPTASLSDLVDVVLSMYVPFFAMIYVARDNDDVVLILKVICVCALFNTTAGAVQFLLQHNFFIQIFPTSMFDRLIENNPMLGILLPGIKHFRHGHYRAEASFMNALSFGEFEIIVIPIGLFFALHREKFSDRILGWAVVFGGIVGIFCSGSRGGWLGIFVSLPVFIAAWSIRRATRSREKSRPGNCRFMRPCFVRLCRRIDLLLPHFPRYGLGRRIGGKQHASAILTVGGRNSADFGKSYYRAWFGDGRLRNFGLYN